ncbi:ArnT family glycosyltransferase [Rubrolithibacter danxiaensis]|uniref:ArnT family glycosyltransferase n=1 Tax=Rubrolithibacter danxiaensis TaxID=3390805 RepID=UPI003BF7B548
MQKLEAWLEANPEKVFFILLLFAVPAFFFNLGLLPLFADEPTRANVALEMILSKNYAVPTIAGEYYYNKPPLYNWILASFYLLTNNFSEFVTRLPALVPLFLFAITIFYSVKYFLKDTRIAALSGILFMVNGRMLFYDSMLGHIDIFYSWLTFLSFMSIFYFYERKQWFLLFLVSYLITAFTFLAKGLPSIVFQGFTILTLLVYTKNFKKLFSWQHILCGLLCLVIIGAYFLNYSRYNPDLTGYFSTIWDQSSQRTAVRVGFWPTLKYILLFPIEHAGHLFPASLLILFCFNSGFVHAVKRTPFLKYITLVFLVNIVVYWLSPQTRPRYLLMLYPLLFTLWSYAFFTFRDKLHRVNKIFEVLLLVISILFTLSVLAVPFAGLDAFVPALLYKVTGIFILLAFFTWLVYKLESQKIVAFIAILLVARLAFSFFVLPYRLNHNDNRYYKNISIEMGSDSQGKDFYFYKYHPDVLAIPFYDRLIFYIERTRMSQVKVVEEDIKPGYYLTFGENLQNPKAVLLKTYKSNLKLFEVK